MTEQVWKSLEPGDFIAQRTGPALLVELALKDHNDHWIGVARSGPIGIRSIVVSPLPDLWELRARHAKASTGLPSMGK
jgi:hypothetical protein